MFHVDSPFTVDLDGRRSTLPERSEGRYGNDDRSALLTAPGGLRFLQDGLEEDLSGLITEIAGPEFTVSGIRFRAAGSFEIVVGVVAAHEVRKNAVEVVGTLEKVMAIGRRLVRGVLDSRGLPFGRVETRMRLLVALVASNFSAVVVVLIVLLLR